MPPQVVKIEKETTLGTPLLPLSFLSFDDDPGAVLWNDLCDLYEDAVSWIRQQPEDEQDWTVVDRLHRLIEAAPDGEKAVRDHEVAALLARAQRAEAAIERAETLMAAARGIAALGSKAVLVTDLRAALRTST